MYKAATQMRTTGAISEDSNDREPPWRLERQDATVGIITFVNLAQSTNITEKETDLRTGDGRKYMYFCSKLCAKIQEIHKQKPYRWMQVRF